jgi:hypothetical protein
MTTHSPRIETRPLDTREKVALVASGGILLASGIYWLMQILDVIEMLRLAYG